MVEPYQLNAVVLSPCELYRRAWKSVLVSLALVNVVQTAAAVPEIVVPGSGQPLAILVDGPGSEHQLALQLGPYTSGCDTLFVVNNYDLRTILPLLRLGVNGFVARGDPVSNIAQSFLATARGQIGLPPRVANRAMSELANDRQQHPASLDNLTQRETEVLQLLADGLSNRDIAESLYLSVRTVEVHLRNLYGKLKVNSRTEAALWAVRHGHAPFVGKA